MSGAYKELGDLTLWMIAQSRNGFVNFDNPL